MIKLAPIAAARIEHYVFSCNAKSCSAVGRAAVKEEFARELESRGLRYGKASKASNPNGPIGFYLSGAACSFTLTVCGMHG